MNGPMLSAVSAAVAVQRCSLVVERFHTFTSHPEPVPVRIARDA
jgi:hypothetical protein